MEYPGRKAQYSQWEAIGHVVRQDTPSAPAGIDIESWAVKVLAGFMLACVAVKVIAKLVS